MIWPARSPAYRRRTRKLRIAGAPLLPIARSRRHGDRASARASSARRTSGVCNVFNPGAHGELRARLLGQEPRRARCRPRARRRQPLRSADRRPYRHLERRDDLLSGTGAARSASRSRSRISRTAAKILRGLGARTAGRHGHRARCRAAGDRRGAARRRDAAAGAAIPPDGVCAGGADRQDAGVDRRDRRHADRSRGPAVVAGTALGAL